MISQNNKKALLLLSVIIFTSGCGYRYTSTENIVVHTNLAQSQWYAVSTSIENPVDKGSLKITVMQNGNKIERIKLGTNPVTLHVAVSQEDLPYSLLSGLIFKGKMIFSPEAGGGVPFRIPFQVYIKPWALTHFWIFFTLLSFFTVIVLLNTAMRFIKERADGYVQFLMPAKEPDPIYPPSTINHFTRNTFTIGSAKSDCYPWVLQEIKKENMDSSNKAISQSTRTSVNYAHKSQDEHNGRQQTVTKSYPGLQKSHLKLTYYKNSFKNVSKGIPKTKLCCLIKSQHKKFYYKEVINGEKDPKDYKLLVNEPMDLLKSRNYKHSKQVEMCEGQKFVFVLDRECVLSIML